jgi:hypothetical protein
MNFWKLTYTSRSHEMCTFFPLISNFRGDNAHRECVVCHGAELVYVFHSISFCPGFYQTPAEQQLSWQMLTYWTSFAHGKVPLVDERKSNVPRMNGNVLRQEQHFHYAMVPRLIHWPQFNSTLYTLRLDIPVGVDIGYNRAKCDFWDTLGYDDQQKILV